MLCKTIESLQLAKYKHDEIVMNKIFIFLVFMLLSGCFLSVKKHEGTDIPIVTGDKGYDLAIAATHSKQTKANLIRDYKGQERVYKKRKPRKSLTIAKSYRPVVDNAYCEGCNYEQDLSACQNIADKNSNIATGAASGAASGAAVTALFGALLGADVGRVATIGATAGGIQGLGSETQTIRSMIARCMQGRGYNVLR